MIPGSKLFERTSRTGDFCEDFFRRFGPDEGFGVGIVMVEVFVDGSFKLWNGGEDAASDAFLGDQAEEALDLMSQEAEVGVKCR